MKKIITSFIILCLIAEVSSCYKEDKKEEESEKTDITFTFYSADNLNPLNFDDDIAKEITRKTGVKLEFIPHKESASQDIQLMIANHNYPDFIFAKSDISKLIENRAIIPLDSYIAKYGKNVRHLYGYYLDHLRNTIEDPKIYTFGTYEIRKKNLEVSGNLQLQNSVLREFGYPKIQTLDDIENILIAYKQKYPEINGCKTIGLSLLTDSWFWYMGLSNPGNYMIGLPDDGQWIVDQETFDVQYKFLHPKMHLFYKWLNKIYHEGLLDPESFTQTEEVWKNKLTSGCVLSTIYSLWGLQDIQKELIESGMESRTYAYLPVTADKMYKDPSMKDYGFSGGWGIAISVTCKDTLRAFEFIDYMCSEEAQILTNWGFEGIDYYYDSKGQRIAVYNQPSSGIGRWTYPFPQGGSGFLDSTGNPYSRTTKQNVMSLYNPTEKETLKAYGAELWTDLFPQPEELGVSKHGQIWQYNISSKSQEIVDRVDDYVKNEIIKIIISSPETFDSSWKKMQENIRKSNISLVEDEITSLIKIKRQLWNY